jgi:hypothetical protein
MALPTSNMRKEQWSYTQLVDFQSWGGHVYRLNKPDGRCKRCRLHSVLRGGVITQHTDASTLIRDVSSEFP